MQFEKPVSLTEVASLLQATLIGDMNGYATGINEIHKVETGDLVFVDHPKYYDTCLRSAASCIIIDREVPLPPGKSLLVVADPFAAYLTLVDKYRPFTPSLVSISETAVIGEGSIVMPGAYIGHRVTIGKNCIIHPQVTILDHCQLGNGVIVQAGTVIGSDAFYYNRKKQLTHQYRKMKSCGLVQIEDQVEIGAGCTIDRGVTASTIIGAGTKIDNQVHIGHDCVIGKNCLIAAQVGLAGAVTVEDEVILWGQVGVNKTLTIGAGAVVFGQSGVASSIDGQKAYWGTPAIDFNEKRRELVWVKRIPSLWEKLKALLR
ncbi:MAG: UDP-3-O-(3-hydroxymyristoyl)glucosamine N-acyltransferase [Sphingomonadales bacterium]|nr:UDP-3-O-(3-hydroxymyristoyl)glucosamine N-acyltransferase [Sphingomonadales bacterium]